MFAKQFGAMFKARTMEFVRDRGSLIWNLVFPILLVFGFAFAQGGSGDRLFKVGVIAALDGPDALFAPAQLESRDEAGLAKALAEAARRPDSGIPPLLADEQVSLVVYLGAKTSSETILKRLSQHQLEMVVDPVSKRYWINPESPKSRLLKRLYEGQSAQTSLAAAASGSPAPAAAAASLEGFQEASISGKAVRYVDWLVPGAIGMNMMFSCLFGVGFVIVRYRKNGVLKRLKATPVSALNFVLAQGASRFVIVLATAVLVYAGTNLFLGFTMNGSYLLLLLLTAFAIVSMLSLGLIFAARFKSEELANGLMNLITFPMIILSGVFFSLEAAPQIVRDIAWFFPLTHFIDSARAIMLDGAGLLAILPSLGFLGVASALFMGIAAWLFKWE